MTTDTGGFAGNSAVNLNDPSCIIAIIRGGKNGYTDKRVEKGDDFIYVVSALDKLHNESINNPEIKAYLQ